MLERYLLVWLTLLSLAAYVWPWSWDPFLATQTWLTTMIAVTMFAIGWMLPRDELRQVACRWPTVLSGTAIQYTTMPLLAYGLGRLYGLDELWMMGIVVAGCVPGAMASNVLTLVARGNVSYSVSLTTMATLISPLVVPLTLSWCLGRNVPFKAMEASVLLGLIVVAPVAVGHLLSRYFKRWQTLAQRLGAAIANATILWIIAVVVAMNRKNLGEIDVRLVAALLSLNVLGYAAGFWGGKALGITVPMRRALTLEVGMQNAGLGTALVTTLFQDVPGYQRAAIPTALYTFGCMLTGTALARYWATRGATTREGEGD